MIHGRSHKTLASLRQRQDGDRRFVTDQADMACMAERGGVGEGYLLYYCKT